VQDAGDWDGQQRPQEAQQLDAEQDAMVTVSADSCTVRDMMTGWSR
jgi:hypothetical protein